MKSLNNQKIIYSINRNDIHNVAHQVLKRDLTENELTLVEQSVGDFIDWFQAIENAIHKHINS